MIRDPDLPTIDKLIRGRVYEVHCRNLLLGVYDGDGGFIGIREKFGDRFLDTELHWDKSEHYGTVKAVVDTKVDVPSEIAIQEYFATKDSLTGRSLRFDRPISEGGQGWIYADTNEPCPLMQDSTTSQEVRPYAPSNKELFDFLERLEKEYFNEENVRRRKWA